MEARLASLEMRVGLCLAALEKDSETRRQIDYLPTNSYESFTGRDTKTLEAD